MDKTPTPESDGHSTARSKVKPGRHWYQYSLRTLFLVMFLAAIGMSWFAVHRQKVLRQREIVKAIECSGGLVGYDYQADQLVPGTATPPGPAWLRKWLGDDFFADVVKVWWMGPLMPSDEEMRLVVGLPRLESILVSCDCFLGGEPSSRRTIPISDFGLAHVSKLQNLRVLDLPLTRITDDGFAHIKHMRQLEALNVRGTQTTDAGLEHIQDLPHLRRLNLADTSITDRGLEQLKGMAQLEVLHLEGTQVSDEGLAHVGQLRQLSHLILTGNQIGDVGMRHLRTLRRLEVLDLNDTRVTNDGLMHVAGMRQLRELHLENTRITDAGLRPLASLRSLRFLWLGSTPLEDAFIADFAEAHPTTDFFPRFGTPVTDKGVKDLQQALSNLTIMR